MMLKRRLSYWLTQIYRPIFEYVDVVFDPSAKSKIHDIELVQNSAVRFISNLKGRTDSVSEAINQLQLQSLEDRRKNHRPCFLTQILQNEDEPRTLSTVLMRLQRTDCWWQSSLVQLPEESQSQYAPRKISWHELFMRCVEKTSN